MSKECNFWVPPESKFFNPKTVIFQLVQIPITNMSN